MATYFHGSSEIEATDGLQTLYILNPSFIPYSSAAHDASAPNTLFLNPMGSATQPAHAPPLNHNHFVGIPLSGPAAPFGPAGSDVDLSRLHEIPSLHSVAPRVRPNHPWGQPDTSAASADQLQICSATNSAGVSPSQRGLSLSLSTEQSSLMSLSRESDIRGHSHHQVLGVNKERVSARNSSSSVSNVVLGLHGVLLGSKYLKAAQELLDEVAHVGKEMENRSSAEGANKEKTKLGNKDSSKDEKKVESSSSGSELGMAQRQELQMKKAKLVDMLDEVEQRYKQYHNQMRLVVSSFEQAAGIRAAKSYTALALQTISRQFKCLKDAISSQIKATGRSLGEDDCMGAKMEGSKLRYVDHHFQQQRALHQLGMIHQNNTWRPQRGLPERAVSVLRAWLFEHFLHPYPKDSDKHMLAKQAGLTRSQVSNWFINARVRLWKPMVEEMYLEETKSREQAGSENGTIRRAATKTNKDAGSKSISQEDDAFGMNNSIKSFQSNPNKALNRATISPSENSNSTSSTSPMACSIPPPPGFTLIGPSSNIEAGIAPSPKKPRMSPNLMNPHGIILSRDMDMKGGEPSRGLSAGAGGGHEYVHGGFGAFSMGNIEGRYGNGVALTLGLPHGDQSPSLSVSATPQNYFPNQSMNNHQLGRTKLVVGNGGEADFFGIAGAPQPSQSGSINYEAIDISNRKRFAAHLLPDYVA
ncbi:BEL1-like homeodomain protein 1 [Syzygium oleosum]|uniref:BEL1-like homeodomain protein 1 n=1 Tax=Syzygium oleosum TaxID=219896 RepID=UPI0011D2BF39|nr:BEL1-like homeodomain protein 1 [Syzygium oleosum]XP_056169014.1 BEL1-like homeodomain protein 1 [Syzygium oleosum]XP_056169015.1 BEL1-like homeodomain protein 1 [Syzygium oleosum]